MKQESMIELGAISEETGCCGLGDEIESIAGPPIYRPPWNCYWTTNSATR